LNEYTVEAYLLFGDIGEPEDVFSLLDELAKQPHRQAITDFRNPNYELMRRLFILSSQIHDSEMEHGFDPHKTSYQRAMVNHLIFSLECSDRADKLAAELPAIKELLLKAWAISLEMVCGSMKPLADKGGKFSNGGRQKGAIAKATQHIIQLVKDHRSLTAKELFAKADKSTIGDMTVRTFNNHVTNARKEYPKERKKAAQ
jgi:hypothetical protein